MRAFITMIILSATNAAGCTSAGSVTVNSNTASRDFIRTNPPYLKGITATGITYSVSASSPNQTALTMMQLPKQGDLWMLQRRSAGGVRRGSAGARHQYIPAMLSVRNSIPRVVLIIRSASRSME